MMKTCAEPAWWDDGMAASYDDVALLGVRPCTVGEVEMVMVMMMMMMMMMMSCVISAVHLGQLRTHSSGATVASNKAS